MLKELKKDKSLGYLGREGLFARNIIFIQYWESFDHLENFAKSSNCSHFSAWQKFVKNIGISCDIGICQEIYEV